MGTLKKGLLLSEDEEWKAMLGVTSLFRKALSLPWILSWFLRSTCATSPPQHKSSDAFVKSTQCVSFTKCILRVSQIMHDQVVGNIFLQFSGLTPPVPTQILQPSGFALCFMCVFFFQYHTHNKLTTQAFKIFAVEKGSNSLNEMLKNDFPDLISGLLYLFFVLGLCCSRSLPCCGFLFFRAVKLCTYG